MEEELEFLEYLHNIIKLEKDAISRIIKMRGKDDLLNKILKEQLEIYKKFDISTKKMIENRKKKTDELSLFAKIASHLGTKVAISNADDIDDTIDMLIKRYQVCIEEIEAKQKESKIKSQTIKNISKRFVEFENKNIDIINKIPIDKV